MKVIAGFALGVLLCVPVIGSEKKVKMEDLPPAVQKAAKEQIKTATLVGVTKEVEKGKTLYEIETKENGKARDLTLDSTGAVVTVEQEVDLDSIPAPAKAAIQKKAVGAKITKVETVTTGSQVFYEAIVTKNGKDSEVKFNADGTPHKE